MDDSTGYNDPGFPAEYSGADNGEEHSVPPSDTGYDDSTGYNDPGFPAEYSGADNGTEHSVVPDDTGPPDETTTY